MVPPALCGQRVGSQASVLVLFIFMHITIQKLNNNKDSAKAANLLKQIITPLPYYSSSAKKSEIAKYSAKQLRRIIKGLSRLAKSQAFCEDFTKRS